MFGGPLQQRAAQAFELLRIQLGRASRRHVAQGVDAAFIEPSLPRVHGLACHANHCCGLCRRLACQQQSPGAYPFAGCLVHLLSHTTGLQSII
jgi:hypothetical protein